MSLEEIADQLYALPPDEFTGARNQAERELRKAGEQEQADEVRDLDLPVVEAGYERSRPFHDQLGMLKPCGTSSAEWW